LVSTTNTPDGGDGDVIDVCSTIRDPAVVQHRDAIATLERLRPDLWVRAATVPRGEVPETKTLATWGARAVVVPYLEGRSTA
jgi:bifunctional ADP-heptose synthase (sugar kinase/adenylyltransferase)